MWPPCGPSQEACPPSPLHHTPLPPVSEQPIGEAQSPRRRREEGGSVGGGDLEWGRQGETRGNTCSSSSSSRHSSHISHGRAMEPVVLGFASLFWTRCTWMACWRTQTCFWSSPRQTQGEQWVSLRCCFWREISKSILREWMKEWQSLVFCGRWSLWCNWM